ncbi:MAG: hypothetical protein ACUVSF_12995 [Anaerolineae bacterium]
MNWERFSYDALPITSSPLVDGNGNRVQVGDFRGQNHLVLLFSHGMDCLGCRQLIDQLAVRSRQLDEVEAYVFIVQPPDSTGKMTLPSPILLLWDQGGDVRHKYASMLKGPIARDNLLVFILDRYGAPQAACYVSHGDDRDLIEEILAHLTLITIQCPECGAPEWFIGLPE